jgi:hypothetical protein
MPSTTGALANGASQSTSSALTWQRVLPDFVSMNTQPFSGVSASAAGGAGDGGGAGGGGAGAAVGVRAGREVGTLGSVGESGLLTGVPVMSDWQPVSSAPTASALARISLALTGATLRRL